MTDATIVTTCGNCTWYPVPGGGWYPVSNCYEPCVCFDKNKPGGVVHSDTELEAIIAAANRKHCLQIQLPTNRSGPIVVPCMDAKDLP